MRLHCYLFNADYPIEASVFFMFDDIGQWWSGCPACARHGLDNINMIDPRYVLETETPAVMAAGAA